MTIIKPKYTSIELEKIRNNAIKKMGEKSYNRTRVFNTFCNITTSFLAWTISIALFGYLADKFLIEQKFSLLFFVALFAMALFIPISFLSLDYVKRGWTNPILFPILKKLNSKWTDVCENFFSTVIHEAKHIENFCILLETHPDCVLYKYDDGSVVMEYIENNFAVRQSFCPEESFSSSTSNFVRNNILDFSYLDKEAERYLETEKG